MIQVRSMMVQQMPFQAGPRSKMPCMEWQMSKGSRTTMLKLASQVKQTIILTAGMTCGRAYWWMRQATQRRAPIICTIRIGQNIFQISLLLFIIPNNILQSSIMHHRAYTRSSNVEALSINSHKQREKNQKGDATSRKHLLGLLASFTREDADVKGEETEELCCFDRMKKLIARREGTSEAFEKDQISSILVEQKINQMESKLKKQVKEKNEKPQLHRRTSSALNFHRKAVAIQELKKGCLNKFVSHQVGKREKDIDDAKKIVDREVNGHIDLLIEDKGLQLIKVKEHNQALKKDILQLNLQIQGLRTREVQMQEYIEELEERSSCHRETKKFIAKNADQKFEERFRQIFGECTLEELKYKLDVGINKCLAGFEKVQNRNQEKMQEQKKFFEKQESKMKKKIRVLQSNENSLLGNLKTLKLNQQLSQIEFDELARAKVDLQSLQKLILAEYTQWYQKRSEGEKNMLRVVGGLEQNYAYEEMVRYIIDFNSKFSTNQKLNGYLFKVLRGIQKLRSTIYPEQCNQKLDPLIAIEHLQKWIKRKVNTPVISKKPTLAQSSQKYEE